MRRADHTCANDPVHLGGRPAGRKKAARPRRCGRGRACERV